MSVLNNMMTQITTSFIFLFVVVLLYLMNIFLSEKLLDQKTKQIWFESGIENKLSSRVNFSVQFFLICLVFIMFDIEVIFLFNFIMSNSQMSTLKLFVEFFLFFLFLYLTLVFEWKIGTITWKF